MQSLDNRYDFLKKYFLNGIKNPDRAISHSILFFGNDIKIQYKLATYVAKLLNCKGDLSENCHCINCNWIDNQEHPAVLTISKVDNKPTDDDSKTVISIKQAKMIKQSLVTSSDYHRVFIFCDKDDYDNPLGLNELNFQEETANALLKTIEEPPANTTFFFLTKNKTDLISTIVSRSQSFFVPSFESTSFDYSLIENIFTDYLEFSRDEVFEIAKNLTNLANENSAIEVVEAIQNYILQLLKENYGNRKLQTLLIKHLEITENAKKHLTFKVNTQSAFENMCLNIIK